MQLSQMKRENEHLERELQSVNLSKDWSREEATKLRQQVIISDVIMTLCNLFLKSHYAALSYKNR